MLTAKICVQYEGDWTAQLQSYDIFGEFVASTFQNRRYIGIMALETSEFDEVLEVIQEHEDTETVDVVERYNTGSQGRVSATLLLRGSLSEFTPLQTLLYEGFLPLGPTRLENGRECFDLLLEDREELSKATTLLSEFGNVNVRRLSQNYSRQIVPSEAEWQELLNSIPERQRELLNIAYDHGYFEIPREVTLEEIADEMGITKTTASNHMRKAQREVFHFILPYINLAMED
ncbi:helix-turn-helix domain-containing protein [Halorussus limi]|uniref:Helix-turn-helix domain-containing protein n=1 Tax=Halorussus limi TaxID=2938695 RepID=A0A8U0HWB7_9EURY|nr:helix-turn-helix domain-containing protein [Halorussus limi]UPV75217.1 helix-turn-helix domain-containing protein [Halorussus limi]